MSEAKMIFLKARHKKAPDGALLKNYCLEAVIDSKVKLLAIL